MKQNQHFQKTACFTVVIWKIMYFYTMNKFKENEQFSVVLSIGQQNDHFQGISCIRFQRRYTVQCIFIKNEQNEHISMKLSKLKKYQILGNFQEIAFHRLVYLYEKLWILRKLANLSDLTEITDSNGFSKESLIPFAVSSQKIAYFQ